MNPNQRRQHLLVPSLFLLSSILLTAVNHVLRSGGTLHEILTTLRQIKSNIDYRCGQDHIPEFKSQLAVFEPITVPHFEPQPEGNKMITGIVIGLGNFVVTMCFFLHTDDMKFIRTQQLFEYWTVASGMGLLALLVTYNEMIWSQRFLGIAFVCYVMVQYAERGQERRQRNRRLDV